MQEGIALAAHVDHAFVNPFQLEDLLIFDEANFCRLMGGCMHKMPLEQLAWAMHSAPPQLILRLLACLQGELRPVFFQEWQRFVPQCKIDQAGHLLLDTLFWELTYWKTPQLYEELVAGERLHPGIFEQLEPSLSGKVVLDAGAGSGRAAFEAIRYGARLVYTVEPSPDLLRLLRRKVRALRADGLIIPMQGDFAHLPLADRSVDAALACSAFTSEPEHGGEAGLAELKRVTRPGGSIVLIWPRSQDLLWLTSRGFRYVLLPASGEMCVHFPSVASARRCVRRFYAGNKRALAYIFQQRDSAEIPFSVLGFNPPCDYCWLPVS